MAWVGVRNFPLANFCELLEGFSSRTVQTLKDSEYHVLPSSETLKFVAAIGFLEIESLS